MEDIVEVNETVVTDAEPVITNKYGEDKDLYINNVVISALLVDLTRRVSKKVISNTAPETVNIPDAVNGVTSEFVTGVIRDKLEGLGITEEVSDVEQ